MNETKVPPAYTDVERGENFLNCHEGPEWDVNVHHGSWEELLTLDMSRGDECIAARVYQPDREQREEWNAFFTAMSAWGLTQHDADSSLGFSPTLSRILGERDELLNNEWRDLDQAWTEVCARRMVRRLLGYARLIDAGAPEEVAQAYA